MKWRSVFALILVIPCVSYGQGLLPEGKGKDIVQTACVQCHALKQVITAKFSRDGWQAAIQRMVDSGMQLSADEVETVVEYLAKNFPTQTQASPAAEMVNVNQATAEDLTAKLSLSDKEAAAVVEYRAQNGKFTKWEDLQKVPGLDMKKIEDKKTVISFGDRTATPTKAN